MIELRLFADYHQLHVVDAGSESDLGEAWTEQAVADGLATRDDAVAVGTAVNVHVAVSVDVLAGPPPADNSDFDHVVEASLRAASGTLVVMGCTDYAPDATRVEVPPGWVRLRVSRSNLDRAYAAAEVSDESAETMERILLQLWPAERADTTVPKRWQAPS